MADENPTIASIGYAFFDPRVESFRFSSKRTPIGHDIVFVHLSGFYREYERDSYKGGALTSYANSQYWVDKNDASRLEGDIRRRQSQLGDMLDSGKTLVVFVPDDEQFWLTGLSDEAWSVLLPVPFPLETEAAEGPELEVRNGEPFASFWTVAADYLEASAVITGGLGTVTLVVRGSSAPVAGYGTYGESDEAGLAVCIPGQLYLAEPEGFSGFLHEDEDPEGLPVLEDHVEFVDAVLSLVDSLRLKSGIVELPKWSAHFALPGETEKALEVRKADASVERAVSRVQRRRQELAILRQRKILFCGTGTALEKEVATALSTIGFSTFQGPAGRTDLVCEYDGKPVVVEVKGLTKSAGEKNSAQLEKWANEYHFDHDEHPKALLVVNGWCSKPVNSRGVVFPHSMLKYAKSREHGLLSGLQLLGAWLEVEAHPEKADEIARSLLHCVGVWDRYLDPSDFLAADTAQNGLEAKTAT
jgi:hypothetical protein